LKISIGYTPEREKADPLISVIEKAAAEFYIAAAPGSWLVDTLPWRTHYFCLALRSDPDIHALF
jgi:hypothetical protein